MKLDLHGVQWQALVLAVLNSRVLTTCEVAQETVVVTKIGDAFSAGYGFYSAVRFFQSVQSVDGLSPILC